MPYPPPPGPPPVGEFQAIGLLPAPQLPDVTGHGGEFLETDGIIPQWEPVSGVLPDPTGHAGEFLTTPDGITVAWAPGGGGGGVTTVGTLTTATANAATIVGSTLSLAPASISTPGVMDTTSGQVIGGFKRFPQGAATNIHDIRDYGAVSFPGPQTGPAGPSMNPATVDCIDAFEAAIAAAMSPGYYKSGIVYVPEGTWYVSRPICFPGPAQDFNTAGRYEMFGDGRDHSIITPGLAAPGDPNKVHAFCGPLIMIEGHCDPGGYLIPADDSPLVGGVGRSKALTPSISMWLHDAYVWTIGIQGRTALSIQLWARVDNLGLPGLRSPPGEYILQGPPATYCSIIGCLGMWNEGPATSNNTTDSAWEIGVLDAGGGTFKFRAWITTVNNGQIVITSSATYANGTTHNLELDYNGSFFDFYVDGVNVGHEVATGAIARTPWEGVAIGAVCMEQLSGVDMFVGCNGAIDSVRLSGVARHTGAGSFTPPASKYTADANTFALINWDQGDAPTGQSLVIGQAMSSIINGPSGWAEPSALVPHYIRISNYNFGAGWGQTTASIHDLQLWNSYQCSGIIQNIAPYCRIENVDINYSTMYGYLVWNTGSFYSNYKNVFVYGGANFGFVGYGLSFSEIGVMACPIGVDCISGDFRDGFVTPFSDNSGINASFIPYMFGPSPLGIFAGTTVSQCGIDQEVADTAIWTREKCAVWVGGLNFYTSIHNDWASPGMNNRPVVRFVSIGQTGFTSIGDGLFPDENGSCLYERSGRFGGAANRDAGLTVINQYNTGSIPLSNVRGWVHKIENGQVSNQVGISASDVFSKNLTGTFQVRYGQTQGHYRFAKPEPDSNYVLSITFKESSGSAPAAGSTDVVGYTTFANEFLVDIGADPGGTCILTFSWLLIRTGNPPLLWVVQPAIPSNYANPLVTASPTGDWAVGVTVVPPAGFQLVYDDNQTLQTVVEAGFPSTTDFWQFELQLAGLGSFWEDNDNSIHFADSYTAGFRAAGQLGGLLNPGSHNVSFGIQGGYWGFRIDNIEGFPYYGYPYPKGNGAAGTQQTPIYVGEQAGGTQALTTVTDLRNLKVDTDIALVQSNEPDYGPWGVMRASQCAIFGQAMTVGVGATGANTGGWASQIANNRYGTKYYWLAATRRQVLQSPTTPFQGYIDQFWTNWGAFQNFAGICIMLGREDIGDGVTAAFAWDKIQRIMAGVPANAEFVPPTSGSATCVINGHTFTSTFNVDSSTTVDDLIALVNAHGPTTAIVTPSKVDSVWVPGKAMQLLAVTPGPAADAITVSTDGAAGANWYVYATQYPEGHIQGGATHLYYGTNGAIANAVPSIVLCNVPPLAASQYSAGKETQRGLLNASIAAYAAAHVADGVVLADIDTLLADPGTPTQLLPAYTTDLDNLNNAGHTALYGYMTGLLP